MEMMRAIIVPSRLLRSLLSGPLAVLLDFLLDGLAYFLCRRNFQVNKNIPTVSSGVTVDLHKVMSQLSSYDSSFALQFF